MSDGSLSLYDAHCHPTDTPSCLDLIPTMKTKKLVCMSTSHKDMSCVEMLANSYPEKIIPAFGFHPWFTYQIYNDTTENKGFGSLSENKSTHKYLHYRKVISPEPSDDFIESLPDLIPLSFVVNEIESRLLKYPHAIVGECGLDKIFRIPFQESIRQDAEDAEEALESRRLSKYRVTMDHQIEILKAQLDLATKHQRPVSLHGVQCPGALYQTIMLGSSVVPLMEQSKKHKNNDKFWPPSICLHSYTGSAEFLKNNWFRKKSSSSCNINPGSDSKDANIKYPRVYVSCSIVINERYLSDLVSVIPDDRLLLESDFHKPGPEMDNLNHEILKKSSQCLGISPCELSQRIEKNICSGFLSHVDKEKSI